LKIEKRIFVHLQTVFTYGKQTMIKTRLLYICIKIDRVLTRFVIKGFRSKKVPGIFSREFYEITSLVLLSAQITL